MLNDSVAVSELNIEQDEYNYYKELWQTIAELREGASAVLRKPQKYLPPRPYEDLEVYKLRLEKLSYTPVMANAVREFVAKLTSAPIHITGIDNNDFWQHWRGSTDGRDKDELELLTDIFSCLLYFGRAFVAIDRPKLGVRSLSRLHDQGLKNQPYIVLYEPLNVIRWDIDNDWYITRQLYQDNQPFTAPLQKCRWTLWDSQSISTYEAEVRLDRAGSVAEVRVGSDWKAVTDNTAKIHLTNQWFHGIDKCPVKHITVAPEQWTGSQVYLKQIQHLRIESAWTDAGTFAGNIQRVFTPAPPVTSDDPRVITTDTDYSQLQHLQGNDKILVGADFKFVEAQGTSIDSLTLQLKTIEQQIKDLVSMRFASADTSVLQQSGKSKQVDQSLLENAMKSYGAKVRQLYQDVLQTVANAARLTTEIQVVGLDTYTTDTVQSVLEQTEVITTLPDIPLTALKIWYGKLCNLLVGTVSPEDEENIKTELEQIFSELEEGTPSDETLDPEILAEYFNLTPDEIAEVLGNG